jgi:hypothetical protein
MTKRSTKIDSEFDPVFAAIATARQKHDAYLVAIDKDKGFPRSTHPKARAASALIARCCGEDWDAIENVADCKPISLAGVSAALRFFAARMGRDGISSPEIMGALLENAALAVEKIRWPHKEPCL